MNSGMNSGWKCPDCGRVNAPWCGTCPCYTTADPPGVVRTVIRPGTAYYPTPPRGSTADPLGPWHDGPQTICRVANA